MLELLRSTVLIARTHFARVALSRRMGLCFLLALGPALLALLIQRSPRPPLSIEIVAFPGFFLILQVAVPVLALVAGSAVVTEEVDDRTITYLFTRPIPRAALLLGRWIASALVLCAILALGVLLLGLAARYGGNPAPRNEVPPGTVGPLLVAAVLGGAVYSALFAAAGTFLKHPMVVGLAYTFTIEGFLANMPGRSQALTIQHYLRSYVAERGHEVWMKIDPMRLARLDTAAEALWTLAIVLAIALVTGAITISRRQYFLPA